MYANQRKSRALNQRLFLLDLVKHSDKNYSFKVEGSTGKHYAVTFNETIKCTCMDYSLRSKNCKHIYFIVAKVIDDQEILRLLEEDPKVNIFELIENIDAKIDVAYNKRKIILTEDVSECDLKSNTCCVCFDDYVENDSLTKCKICTNHFHAECIKIWMKSKESCPLCRSHLGTIDNITFRDLKDPKDPKGPKTSQ
jgi:hypothetical protein